MPLETVSYISDLVITNPDGSDQRSTADDHLRNIKKAITQTFPAITGLVSVSHTELNRLDGISANIETRLDAHIASISAINTTISGITTTLAAYGASISAINTSLSDINTRLNNVSASFGSLISARVTPTKAVTFLFGAKIWRDTVSATPVSVLSMNLPTNWTLSATYSVAGTYRATKLTWTHSRSTGTLSYAVIYSEYSGFGGTTTLSYIDSNTLRTYQRDSNSGSSTLVFKYVATFTSPT